jgi:hypothetical protein
VLWVLRSGGPTIQPEMAMVRDALIWASLALTIYSGGAYLVSARTILETNGEGNSA